VVSRAGGLGREAVDTLKRLYTCYMETDASLAEINPLILEGNGNIRRSTPSSTSTRTHSTVTRSRRVP